MLEVDQIQSFKDHGYLILPGFVDSDQVHAWREQFWAHLDCSIDEPDQWPDRVEGFAPDPLFGDLPELQAIAKEFGGGYFNGGGCGVQVRWPQSDAEWTMPDSGHLDGYPGEGCQAVLMMGATTYLYDVEPGGGSYVYWPDSHRIAHRYFRRGPDRRHIPRDARMGGSRLGDFFGSERRACARVYGSCRGYDSMAWLALPQRIDQCQSLASSRFFCTLDSPRRCGGTRDDSRRFVVPLVGVERGDL